LLEKYTLEAYFKNNKIKNASPTGKIKAAAKPERPSSSSNRRKTYYDLLLTQ